MTWTGQQKKRFKDLLSLFIFKRGSLLGDEAGIALLMSLLMLFLLSLLGMTVLNLSGTDLQTTTYERMSNRAFSSAESGITQARNDLQVFVVSAPQNGQWTANDGTVIAGVMGGGTSNSFNLLVSGVPMSFSYTIADFGAVNDQTVLITSTGAFKNIQQRVEAVLKYEPPDPTGAQECYNAKCSSADQSSGKTVTFTGTPNSSVDL